MTAGRLDMSAPTDGGSRGWRAPGPGALGLVGVLAFIAFLEVIPRVGVVSDRYLPPPSVMFRALADLAARQDFWVAIGNSLVTWSTGLVISLAAAVVLGLVIGSIPVLYAATASTIEFLRPIPAVALIPLAVLVLGTGRQATLMLVIYATFWQVLIQVLAGVQDVDPVARDTARSYRFGRRTTALRVVWPTTLPYAMTGFRLGATVALILTITGELIIGTPGLGRQLSQAQQAGQYDSMYAVVIVAGLLGAALNLSTRRVERRVLHWHQSVRGEVAS